MIKFKKRMPTALTGISILGLALASTASMAAPSQTQIDALLAVYDGLNGHEWTENSGWNDPTSNPCDGWAGVTCDSSGTNITELYIGAGNNVFGSISSEISGLTELQNLVIESVGLNGTSIPASIGTLTKLKGLYLNDNTLSGTIPVELGQLSQLQMLVLEDNQLTGNIPVELMSLTKLYGLRLHGNYLTGTIPSEISNLTSLRALTLHRNSLSGVIPSELASLTDFSEKISLDWNALHTSDATVSTLINQSSEVENYNYIDTQTIDASPDRPAEIGETSVRLHWDQRNTTPATEGGYKIYMSTDAAGPYALNQSVADKTSDTALVDGLTANTTYYFQVRSYTSPHEENLQSANVESSGLYYNPKEVTTLAAGSGNSDVTGADVTDVTDSDGDDSSSSGGGGGTVAWLLVALASLGFRTRRRNR